MPPRTRALLLAYPLAELLLAIAVASAIGWGWTILALLAGIPVGLAIAASAGRGAMERLRAGEHAEAGGHAGRLVAGLVIAVPGFATDIVGALLLVPAVRRVVGARLGIAALVSGSFGSGTVVRGTVVKPPEIDPGPR